MRAVEQEGLDYMWYEVSQFLEKSFAMYRLDFPFSSVGYMIFGGVKVR